MEEGIDIREMYSTPEPCTEESAFYRESELDTPAPAVALGSVQSTGASRMIAGSADSVAKSESVSSSFAVNAKLSDGDNSTPVAVRYRKVIIFF